MRIGIVLCIKASLKRLVLQSTSALFFFFFIICIKVSNSAPFIRLQLQSNVPQTRGESASESENNIQGTRAALSHVEEKKNLGALACSAPAELKQAAGGQEKLRRWAQILPRVLREDVPLERHPRATLSSARAPSVPLPSSKSSAWAL